MPEAHQGEVQYHYDDHDTDVVDETPPVQNTWYEVFDAEDVRLLYNSIMQSNDEAAAKTLEVRWTIDGNVYFVSQVAVSGTYYYIFRHIVPSGAGTAGLLSNVADRMGAFYTDKRGKEFKVEVRIISVVGTNQRLLSYGVRETHDQT